MVISQKQYMLSVEDPFVYSENKKSKYSAS